jgi:hypothetical protein
LLDPVKYTGLCGIMARDAAERARHHAAECAIGLAAPTQRSGN